MPVINIPPYGPIRFSDSLSKEELAEKINRIKSKVGESEYKFDPREELSFLEKLKGGAKRALSGIGSLVTDVVPAIGGSLLGFEDYAREQMAEAAQKRAAAELESPTAYRKLSDVRGIGDVPGFLAETLGEGAVDIASLLVPGGVGSVVGRRLAQRGAAEAGEQIASRIARRGVPEGPIVPDVLKGLQETATRRAATSLGQAGADLGFKTGLRGGAYGLASGEIFQSVEEETGKLEPTLALALGVPFAALDSLLPETIAKQLGATGKAVLTKEMLERSTLPEAKSLAARLSVSIPSLVAKEGLTEAAQENISILAEQIAGSKKDFFDPENVDRMLMAGVKGGIAGGVFGAPGAAIEAVRDKRADQALIDAELARREKAKTPEEKKEIEQRLLLLGYELPTPKFEGRIEPTLALPPPPPKALPRPTPFTPIVTADGTVLFTRQEAALYEANERFKQEQEANLIKEKEEAKFQGKYAPQRAGTQFELTGPGFGVRAESLFNQEGNLNEAAPEITSAPITQAFLAEAGIGKGSAPYKQFIDKDLADPEVRGEFRAFLRERAENPSRSKPVQEKAKAATDILARIPFAPADQLSLYLPTEIGENPVERMVQEARGRARPTGPTRVGGVPESNLTEQQMRERNLADIQQEQDRQARERFEAELAETDLRVQANQAQRIIQERNTILDDVLADPQIVNQRKRFSAELRRAGYTDTNISPAEEARIARFNELKETFPDLDSQEVAARERAEAEERAGLNELESLVPERKPKQAPTPKKRTPPEATNVNELDESRSGEGVPVPSRSGERVPTVGTEPPVATGVERAEPATEATVRGEEVPSVALEESKGARIERKESFRGRTTPDVEYIVYDQEGNRYRTFKTKKEAQQALDMLTMPREDFLNKYPDLKAKVEEIETRKKETTKSETEPKVEAETEPKTEPKKETPSAAAPTETKQAKKEGTTEAPKRAEVAEPATGESTETDRTMRGQMEKVKTEREQKRKEAKDELGVFLEAIEEGFLNIAPNEVGTDNDQERVKLLRRNATTEAGKAARIYFTKVKRLVDALLMIAYDIAYNVPRARSVANTHPFEAKFFAGMNAENATLAAEWVRNNLSDEVKRKLTEQIFSAKRAARVADKLFNKYMKEALDAKEAAEKKAKGQAAITHAELDDVLKQTGRYHRRVESLNKIVVSGEGIPQVKYTLQSGVFIAKPADYDSMDYNLNVDAVSPLTQPLHPAMESALRAGDLASALRMLSVQGGMIGRIANALLAGNLKTKVKVVDGLKENGRAAAGYYDPKTDTIYLDSETGLNNHVALHEAVHAATSHVLANKSHPVTKQLQALFDAIKDQLGSAYGAQSLDEFVAEAFSNPEFQAQLAGIKIAVKDGRPISAWNRFINTITNFVRRLMGLEARPLEAKSAMDIADELITQIISPAPESRDGARLMMQATMNPNGFINFLDRITEKAIARGPNSTLSKIAVAINEFLSGTLPKAFRSGILASLTNEAFVEVAEKYLPGVTKLDQYLDERGGYEFKMLKRTEPVIVAVEKWAKNKGEAAVKLLNKVIYGSTLARVDPTKPRSVYERATVQKQLNAELAKPSADQDVSRIDILKKQLDEADAAVKAWDTLNAAFKKLDPEGQNLYRQMRDTYGGLYQELLESIEDRINTLIGDKTRAEAIKKDIWAKITSRGGIDPYFPLTRKGSYWLSYTDAQGEHYVSAYESRFARKKAIETLKAKNFSEFEEFSNLDQFKVFQRAPSTSFINGVIKTLELNRPKTADAAVLDQYKNAEEEIVRLFLNTLPETAFAQSFQAREDRLGFDEDAIGALRTKSFSLSRQIANMRYGAKMQDLLAKMAESIKSRRGENKDPKQLEIAQQYLEELGKRVKAITDPDISDWSRLLTSFGFNMTLGLNLSSAIINLSQVPLVVLPMLGGKYGYDEARQAIQRAYMLFGKTGFNTEREVDYLDENGKPTKAKYKMKAMPNLGNINFDDPNLSPDMRRLKTLAEMAEKRGMLNSSQLYDTLEANEGASFMAKFNAVTGFLFHHGERMNRQVSMVAAYELELARLKKEGKTGKAAEEDAANYAIYTTKLTNGGTSSGSAPRIAQNNIGRVVFMFKRYGVSMYYMLFKTANELLRHEDRAVRDQAKRQIAGIYGMAALFAGVQGLPFFGLAAMVYAATLADDDDKEDTLEIQTRKYMGELAYKGLFNHLFNVDVAARMGFNDLIVRDVMNEADKTLIVRAAEMLGGPVVGSVSKIERGFNLMRDGEMYRGVEAMLPTAIGNTMKATRFLSEGTAKTLRGDPIVDDVSAGNVLAQFFGFAPADLTKQLEINAREKGIDRRSNEEKTKNLRKYYVASRVGDQDGMEEAKEELRKLSEKHKGLFPNGLNKTIQRSMEQHAKSTERMYHGVLFSRGLEDELRKDAAELED